MTPAEICRRYETIGREISRDALKWRKSDASIARWAEYCELEQAFADAQADTRKRMNLYRAPRSGDALPHAQHHNRSGLDVCPIALRALPDGARITNGEFIGLDPAEVDAATGGFAYYEKRGDRWYECGAASCKPAKSITLGNPVVV